MGRNCSQQCAHGRIQNGACVCDPCYNGQACDLECSRNGICTVGQCQCFKGVKGEFTFNYGMIDVV